MPEQLSDSPDPTAGHTPPAKPSDDDESPPVRPKCRLSHLLGIEARADEPDGAAGDEVEGGLQGELQAGTQASAGPRIGHLWKRGRPDRPTAHPPF